MGTGLEKECHRSCTSSESQSCYSRRTRGNTAGGDTERPMSPARNRSKKLPAVLTLSAQTPRMTNGSHTLRSERAPKPTGGRFK